jgi:UDP-N-acetylmuramate dehydrogenase
MIDIQEYVDTKDYSTLKVGGRFRYLIEITEKEQLSEAYDWAQEKSLPVLVLGGGSNMVFSDGVIEVVALCVHIHGFQIVNEEHGHVDIRIGAGEIWDSVVERAVGMNLSGIEAMSAIPGTTGATPVQNVGAYGQEIKDTLLSVEVFNIEMREFETIYKQACRFEYRDSIFKNEAKGKYVIMSVTLRLSKSAPSVPNYPGVQAYFKDAHISKPTLREIREAVIAIRSVKLPDPTKIANVGSFFKNPIVLNDLAEKLKSENPKLVVFPIDPHYSKVPAGFLIEACGLKGQDFGAVSVYNNNALVLVNNGMATRADIEHVRDEIIKKVYEKFGITIETEPEFV